MTTAPVSSRTSHLSRTSHPAWLGALALTLAACSAAPPPPFDAEAVSLYALVATIDGTTFLPPLGPEPGAAAGTFDPTLAARLQVVLEAEDAAGRAATLGTFPSSTRPGLVLLAPHELYWMNVPAAAYFTDPALAYRFRVLLDGREIGRSDMSSKVFEVMRYVPTLDVGVKLRIETRAAPVLTTLSPSSGVAGTSLDLTLSGASFSSDSVVHFAGHDLTPRSTTANQIVVTLSEALLAQAGTYDVTVSTPAPGGGTSRGATFTVEHPAPALTSLTPPSAFTASGALTLTIDGAAFAAGALVHIDGAVLDTTFVSSTRLLAALPASFLVAPRAATITVENPAPAAPSTATLVFSVVPACGNGAIDPGETCDGNCASTCNDGNACTTDTMFGSAANCNVACTHQVITACVSGDGCCPAGCTGANDGDCAPILSSLSPATAPATASPLTITLSGTNFSASSHVTFSGASLATTFVSSTQLTAVVPGASLASPGSFAVTVVNPAPSGPSSALTFTVTAAVTGVATSVAAGYYHTCVIRADATVWCRGYNAHGELGNGTTTDAPRTSTQVSGLTNAVQISSAVYHTCARKTDGTVWCWGYNNFGQVGDGSTTNALVAAPVSGLSSVAEVAVDLYHTCARKTDGTIWCWGRNANGQLGNGTTTNSSTPVQVSGITTATAIAAGGWAHTCALLADRTVRCWGSNVYGQLGNGTTTDAWVPVQVSSLRDVTAIATRLQDSCAVIADGTARCWGYNAHGQLGTGTTTNSSVPVSVFGLTSVVSIIPGVYWSCALLSNGTARCWGLNSYGQLGDGTITESLTPVVVSGLTNARLILSGANNAVAQLADGTLRAWGFNAYGQLGTGNTNDAYTPVIATF